MKIDDKFLPILKDFTPRVRDFYLADFTYKGQYIFDQEKKDFSAVAYSDDGLPQKKPNMIATFDAMVFDNSFVDRGFYFQKNGEPLLKPAVAKRLKNDNEKMQAMYDISNWALFSVQMNYANGKFGLYQKTFAPIQMNHDSHSYSVGECTKFEVRDNKLMCNMNILMTNAFGETMPGADYASKVMAGMKMSISAGCLWNEYDDMDVVGDVNDYAGDENDPIKFSVNKFQIKEISIVNNPAFAKALVSNKPKE